VALIGDGPLRPELEARVRALGIGASVELLGWKDAAAVRAELLRARALVLPSLAEGLPIVLMEALALRRPVVTTWVAGIPELVRHREHGWLVPPGSVEALADAMREVALASGEELMRMGEAGARRVRERHALRAQGEQLERLFVATREARRRP
jgi:glycosyltransferase involved in cell wall biosynthesis